MVKANKHRKIENWLTRVWQSDINDQSKYIACCIVKVVKDSNQVVTRETVSQKLNKYPEIILADFVKNFELLSHNGFITSFGYKNSRYMPYRVNLNRNK